MRLSVSTRIFLFFVVVIVSFGATSAYTVYRMSALRKSVTAIWEDVMPLANELEELQRKLRAQQEFLELRRPMDARWLSRLLPKLKPFERLRRVEERLRELAGDRALPRPDRQRLARAARELETFRSGSSLSDVLAAEVLVETRLRRLTNEELFRRLVRQTVMQANEGSLRRNDPEARATLRILQRIARVVSETSPAVSRLSRELSRRAAADERAAILAVLAIGSGALLLSLFMLWMVRRTLAPIRYLREGARRIAAGDYDERVEVRTRDEIGQLAEEFNTMAEALRARDAELARQREELLRADRLATIGKLAAQITHEVRNPLSSIALNAELLHEDLEETGEARELVDSIEHEVGRLKAITEEYLHYARLPRPELEEVDVGERLRAFIGFLQPELDEADVEIVTEGVQSAEEGGPAAIRADPEQLRQAWLNVARNAVEALREQPGARRLRVTLRATEEEGVRIAFGDNGPGITPRLREGLFDPFVTGKSGGTGLGLPLSQQIVADHGGRIELDPEAPEARMEGGACFVLWLPRDPTRQLAADSAAGGARPA